MRKYISRDDGSATILTILISVVIITVGIGFNWLLKEHLKVAEGLKNKSEAMLNAYSTYNAVLYSILTGRVTPRNVTLTTGKQLLGVHSIPLDGTVVDLSGQIRIRLQDTNGMFSLNNLNVFGLERLMKIVRQGEDAPSGTIDSFLDWIDRDKLVRINGAEDSFYSTKNVPYTPRNYFMQYKEELGFLRGMDDDLYQRLSPYITILPNTGFNPNTASQEVLMAYLDIDHDVLRSFNAYREKKTVASDTELFSLTGRRIVGNADGVFFFPSYLIEITIDAGYPKTIYSIKAGIDIKQNLYGPYSVVYWKEE